MGLTQNDWYHHGRHHADQYKCRKQISRLRTKLTEIVKNPNRKGDTQYYESDCTAGTHSDANRKRFLPRQPDQLRWHAATNNLAEKGNHQK